LSEFEALRYRLTNGEKQTYAEIAAALGVTETDVKNRARALDLRYQRALFAVVRDSTESDDEAREEILELFSAFR
jgi:thioredoxin-like negative regulator of GroEL